MTAILRTTHDLARVVWIRAFELISVGLLIWPLSNGTPAATSSNARSAMGINLAAVNYFASEQPFINGFLESQQWITHSDATWDTKEEQYIHLDANGWPITLTSLHEPSPQRFNSVGVIFLQGMPSTPNGIYPGGQYVVLYDGQGTLAYGFDATLVSRSPGRDVINVVPSNNGIDLRIVETDPHHHGNYLRNIRFVTAANESAAKAGQLFNPAFLKLLQNFRALRFMDWFRTNETTLSSWSERPIPTYAFFGTPKGVPIEIAVQLANAVSADAWMNVPVTANDEYITQMAMLVHNQLGKSQKVYVELSNEVWNSSFPQYKYAVTQGQALWPNQPSGDTGFEYNREWFGMRTAQMCDIWRSVWGLDLRLVCVLGAQAAWSFSATEALRCPYWTQGAPCSGHAINAVAIAPYMGGEVPSAWTSQADGGLANLFQSLYLQNDPAGYDGSYLRAYGESGLGLQRQFPREGSLLRTPHGNGTSSGFSPPTSSRYWHTRVDRTSRMDRPTRSMLSTSRPTEIREWARRMHAIFSNGKLQGDNSSCTSRISEWRASTAPGAPSNRSCKRPLRSTALRRSGKPSRIFSRKTPVGGRVVRARSSSESAAVLGSNAL